MKKTGLSLGGGVVLGAAHVGTLRAIDEFDMEINYVAGTSIGAFVAAFFAFGKNWKEIKKIASELKWIDITGISLSRYGLLSNEKLGELIIKHLGNKNIEDADIPLAIVATDVTSGEKVILDKGSLADAVMASTCIPGIFKPVEINAKMLVDGGIVENVPINTTMKMGAEYVIGVDLNSKHKYDKPDNILDVIMNSFHFLMQQSDKLQTKDADLLIKPDLSSFNRSDINQIDDLIEKGYEDSRKVLKEEF
ncbi:MAG: patatin-like phospholipase family protein [Bacteroidales bacterium]|nr:patatin-like phospholipase family protein [Bacteroidales bacterium]